MTPKLGFPVFDGDNHMYETRDALTKFLPPEYHGAIRYVEVDGRTKIATLGQISEYIPNPTFDKVAAPGAQEDYFHNGNPEGKSHREILGKAIEATPAMREPAPRLALLDEQGIDKSMMYPTLASLVEERFREHPEATHTIIHGLNQWLHETWQFDYKGRIFTTPDHHLAHRGEGHRRTELGGRARCARHSHPAGAGTRAARPAVIRAARIRPVLETGRRDRRAGHHARLRQRVFPVRQRLGGLRRVPAVPAVAVPLLLQPGPQPGRGRGRGAGLPRALTRFPELRIGMVENGTTWLPRLLENLSDTRKKMPQLYSENPVEAIHRCVYFNPFWEENVAELAKLVPIDHLFFGSDYPHPEGLADPLSYAERHPELSDDEVAMVMGGTLSSMMRVDA